MFCDILAGKRKELLTWDYFDMKTLLIILAVLFLSSCARVTVQTENTPSGTDWNITYSTFMRKVEDVKAEVGDVTFGLGSAGNDIPLQNEVIACMIAPALCK